MAEKKFVLFIVEGLNDKKEIDAILHTPYFSEFMNNYKPFIKMANTDVTSDKNSTEKNIKEKVGLLVRDFRKSGVPFSDIKPSDISCIIHIVDTDGAFIPRSSIIESDDVTFVYETDCIRASNPDVVFGRNRKKANNIRVLMDTKQIDNIPYSIYFASCNMEHVLFGRVVNEGNKMVIKKQLADQFIIQCKKNPAIVKDTVFNDQIAYDSSFEESWGEIQKDTNSLKRHTNLNLYLKTIMSGEEAS